MKRIEVIFKLDNKQTLRVVRGGAWGGYPGLARVAVRFRYLPTRRHNLVGFRLVKEL